MHGKSHLDRSCFCISLNYVNKKGLAVIRRGLYLLRVLLRH